MTQLYLTPMKEEHIPFLYVLLNIPEIMDALHMAPTTLANWQEAYSVWASDPDEENYIVESGSTPVAWLSLNGLASGITAWIKMLVVHPQHQRAGVGTFAIEEAEQILKRHIFDKLYIQTTADNLPAQQCYEKYGFSRIPSVNQGKFIYEKAVPLNIQTFAESTDQEATMQAIFHCDWRAAKFLAQLLKENLLEEYVGEGTLYLLWCGTELAGFIILGKKDGLPDPNRTPWLSFLFVAPAYRGRRLGKRLIDHACEAAKESGYQQVFLYTDHEGLYEKYGFTYLESRKDVWGDMSRIYLRVL